MSILEERKAKMMEDARIRREEETKSFLSRIDKIMNNTDNMVHASVQVMRELNNCYIVYYVIKYPNCFVYSLTRYKKDYPFSIYYTKEFKEDSIPEKYRETFLELEKQFK